MNFHNFLLVFIPIFVAMDSIGAIPVYTSLTSNLSKKIKNKIIFQAILTSFTLGILFIFFGRSIFNFLNITTSDFKVAGGILLLILAVKSMMETYTIKEHRIIENYEYLGIVPIAIPLIVGPAVLTTLIILNDEYGLFLTLIGYITNLIIISLFFKYTELVNKIIGKNGELILSKIANIFLAAIAIMMIRIGLFEMIKEFIGRIKL